MAILTKIHPSTKVKGQATDAQSVFVGLDVHKETLYRNPIRHHAQPADAAPD